MYFAYSLLLLLALVLATPWWLLEMVRHGKYRMGWRERLGIVPHRLFDRVASDTIWIHAVSVGEVLAVSRMVDELKARLPGWRVVISTTTDTGQKLARQRFGDSNVFYFPLDFGVAVQAYLRALRPKLLVLAESEFWPNLLHEARISGASTAVVNARVSDRSLPRYLRFRNLLSRVMQNVDLFLAQSDEDARRLVQIGAPKERVHVGGNLKFEVKPPEKPQVLETFGAAARVAVIGTVTDVRTVVSSLARTMEKIHHDRNIAIEIDASEGTRFRGEQQDLEEMVGNLVDNACKWAQSRVAVEVFSQRSDAGDERPTVHIIVDDDGPGLSPQQREQVARRGRRLDETKPGSGLGLSIVVDLASLYGGSLALGTAPIGGLRAELILPGGVS